MLGNESRSASRELLLEHDPNNRLCTPLLTLIAPDATSCPAAIDNDNTRRAYGRSLGSFFAFREDGGKERVQDIGPLDVRDYLEAAKANGLSTATPKQHMAAIRMLFDHLVTGGVLEHNPALSVKAPRQKLGKGKTPILTAEEAGELLRSIETETVVGLRDRALIGVMVFTSPACPPPAA